MAGIDDYHFIRERFIQFLKASVKCSADNPAPAKNAANGYFREAVWHDDHIKSALVSPAERHWSPEGKLLWDIFHYFMKSSRNDFGNNDNYDANWTQTFSALSAFLEDVGDEAAGVLLAICQLLGEDEESEETDADKQDLAQAIAALMRALNETDVVTHGKHANGHIAAEMHGTAQITIEKIDHQTTIGHRDLKRLRRALKLYCKALKELPNGEGVHAPWLRAEWQVGYEAVTRAALLGLKRLPA